MKIVCGSCGAKYSIADEKVQGKVFKIRCKKCSNVIVVKGNSGESATAADEGADFGGDSSDASEWYVVVDGDQIGPITSVEMDSYYMSGKINAESYIWRDGLSDWMHLKDVDAFGHLVQDHAGPEEKTQISDGYGGEPEDDATTVMASSEVPGGDLGAEDPFAQDQGYGADEQGYGADEQGYGADEQGYGADEQGYGAAEGAYGGDDQGYGGSDPAYGADEQGYGADEPAYGADEDYGYGGEEEQDYGYAAAGEQEEDQDYGGGGFESFGAGGGAGFGGAAEQQSGDGGGDEGAGGMFAAFDSGGSEEPAGGGGDGGNSDFMSFGPDAGGGGGDAGSANGANGSNGQPGMVSQNDMIGQRNENSVLFSLSSLDQVQAVGGGGGGGGGAEAAGGGGASPMPSPGPTGPAGGGGDAPNTEGSGLIDIRALASAHSQMKDTGGGQGGGADQLDPFSQGTMAMPALMPMGSHKSNKPLIIAAVVGGIFVLGLAGVAVYFLAIAKEDQQPKVITKVVKEQVPAPSKVDEEKSAKDTEEAEKAAAAALENKGEEDGKEAEESVDDDEKETKKTAKKKRTRKKRKAAAKKDDDEPKKKRTRKSSGKKDDGIDKLLGQIDKKKGSSDSEPAPKKNLKKKLSRSDVLGTIKRYSGRVSSCHKKSNKNNLSGKMKVKFYIKPGGRVTNATVVSGNFKGTDLGSCVKRVVRGMKFPETAAKNNVPVTYPFILR